MSKKGKKTRPAKPAASAAKSAATAGSTETRVPKASAAEQTSDAKEHLLELRKDMLSMSDRIWLRWAAGIVALATFLRFFDITNRPVHHDEGVNGWFMTNLIRDGLYKYDPANYHGPSLYFWAWPWLKLFGFETVVIRVCIAVWGLAMVVLVLYLKRYLGKIGTLIAAFLVAISPGMVFVSRYFIHEIFFVFLSLGIVVSVLYFMDKREAGPGALAWMSLILIYCFVPSAIYLGSYLGGYFGGENTAVWVWGLRTLFFAGDLALTYWVIQRLKSWRGGQPVYMLLASACLALYFATKETAFIALGTMAIAIFSIWIWEKIGPDTTSRSTWFRNVLIGNAVAVAVGLYYYNYIADGFKWMYQEFIVNPWRPPETIYFYSILLFIAAVIVAWVLYVLELKQTNETEFEETPISFRRFRESVGDSKTGMLLAGLSFLLFAYLIVLFFSSFFTYMEGVSKAFEAYAIWKNTGTKEHAQNGFFAYFKWGFKVESAILLISLLGSLVAVLKARHRFAMFSALWAIGVFIAYTIIPYKTPWLALSYILPMCMVAGYGLGEFIGSKNLRLNIAAYALMIIGTFVLGYQTYYLNFVRYDDDQMPYVYAHTRRGFLDMIKQIEHYAEKSGKGKDAVIDVVSPDYWPMTWYTVNYNHVGYHGHLVDTQAEMIVCKKKDQDAAAIQKYSDNYRYVGMYPLRPGVDLNLLVRKDIADPTTQELSKIPDTPATP
jgi:Dolichyl-phosphate-mannose-protein mannosyltransferase